MRLTERFVVAWICLTTHGVHADDCPMLGRDATRIQVSLENNPQVIAPQVDGWLVSFDAIMGESGNSN